MKRTALRLLIFSAIMVLLYWQANAVASDLFILKGEVVDADGNPVEGGEVFIYNTSQTRRPADFISPQTDGKGEYRTEIPSGRYWLVARVRSGAGYGPLAIGKKHSGEAIEIEGVGGDDITVDFTVADVREMARSRQRVDEGFRRVEGRLLDMNGKPVKGGYVFARLERNCKGVPDFISPSSNEEGRYILFLPEGNYCMGGATGFPPGDDARCTELPQNSSKKDIVMDMRLDRADHDNGEGESGINDND